MLIYKKPQPMDMPATNILTLQLIYKKMYEDTFRAFLWSTLFCTTLGVSATFLYSCTHDNLSFDSIVVSGALLGASLVSYQLEMARRAKRMWLKKEIAKHKKWHETADENNMFRSGHMLYLQQCEWLLATEFAKQEETAYYNALDNI
jgi:hypothetical protein